MADSITLEEGAKRLVELVLAAEPGHRERIALGALRAAKLVAYHENHLVFQALQSAQDACAKSLMAARFHAGSMARQCDDAVARVRQPALPETPTFGGAHVEGDRVVVHCVASLTPDAAERLAHQLYAFAAQAREEGRRG